MEKGSYRVVVREDREWNISKGRWRRNVRSNYKEKENIRRYREAVLWRSDKEMLTLRSSPMAK